MLQTIEKKTYPIPATGTCEVCKKENVSLTRTYFHYDLQCECHSPNHFDLFDHCSECKPKQPLTTKAELRTSKI